MSMADSVLAYFAVNPLVAESDLSKVTEEETRRHLAELRPKFLGLDEDPDKEIFGVRLGVELTNPLILFVLLVLAAEMVIAGRWKPVQEQEI
jgi:hypothetical protein